MLPIHTLRVSTIIYVTQAMLREAFGDFGSDLGSLFDVFVKVSSKMGKFEKFGYACLVAANGQHMPTYRSQNAF